MTGIFQKLHRNERGEMPIGPILILALIVIPLVIFLLSARDSATETTKDQWGEVIDKTAPEETID